MDGPDRIEIKTTDRAMYERFLEKHKKNPSGFALSYLFHGMWVVDGLTAATTEQDFDAVITLARLKPFEGV